MCWKKSLQKTPKGKNQVREEHHGVLGGCLSSTLDDIDPKVRRNFMCFEDYLRR